MKAKKVELNHIIQKFMFLRTLVALNKSPFILIQYIFREHMVHPTENTDQRGLNIHIFLYVYNIIYYILYIYILYNIYTKYGYIQFSA